MHVCFVRSLLPNLFYIPSYKLVFQFRFIYLIKGANFFCLCVHLVCTNFSDFAEQGRQT